MMSIGGSRGGHAWHMPPMGPNSFIFAYIFTEKCPRRRSMPSPNGCMPPRTGNPGSATDEIVKLCRIHLMYLGRGMFIELIECATPLELAQNDEPQVQSLIIGELTMGEHKAYDGVLLSGLGVGLNSANKNKPDTPNNAKYDSDTSPLNLSLPQMEKQQCQVTENTSLLDLSIDSKPGSDKIHDEMLDLSMEIRPSTSKSLDEIVNLSAEKPVNKDQKREHETAAKHDQPLNPSPPPMLDKAHPEQKATRNKELHLKIKKLDLRPDQLVEITPEILNKLPINRYRPQPDIDVKHERKEEGYNSDPSASTILYSWVEEPLLLASDIPPGYLKPKFKVPASLLIPKP